jgi:hypothetical protein
MPMCPDLHDEFRAAVEAEDAAWQAIKGKLPGCIDYEQGLWDTWVAAVRRSDSLRDSLAAQVPEHRRFPVDW